jgi:hypothetical protein
MLRRFLVKTLSAVMLFATGIPATLLHAQTAPSAAYTGTYTSFDAPDDCGSTIPQAINNSGAITGFCGSIAFLREPDGTMITVSVPGADSSSAYGINEAGTVVGQYCISNICHGFLRSADGTFTTFDVPGAINTTGVALNDLGAVTGVYTTPESHGFVRSPDGQFATFDGPGSNYTIPLSINDKGVVAGYYSDLVQNDHCMLWSEASGLITIETPGFASSTLLAINNAGAAMGSAGNYAFILSRGGVFTFFEGPGNFIPFTFNNHGDMVGEYVGEPIFSPIYGLLQFPNGSYTFIGPPGSEAVDLSGINDYNSITGSYVETRSHAFVLTFSPK